MTTSWLRACCVRGRCAVIPTESIPFLTSAAVWTCVVPAAAFIATSFRLMQVQRKKSQVIVVAMSPTNLPYQTSMTISANTEVYFNRCIKLITKKDNFTRPQARYMQKNISWYCREPVWRAFLSFLFNYICKKFYRVGDWWRKGYAAFIEWHVTGEKRSTQRKTWPLWTPKIT